jgi:monoamine oxidase
MLDQAGRDYQLIEKRGRLGGRMLSELSGDAKFDLGPAWFWPGQPRMADLAARFGLGVFEQYASGDFRFEDAQGRLQQGRGAGSMQGSLRVDGGMSAVCDALADALDTRRVHLRTTLDGCTRTPAGLRAVLDTGDEITAQKIVLALPPRLAADIAFTPALPPTATQTMGSVPTWMAGQAKAIAVYDTPFWRAAGLSGDAMSQRGPMVEIHDASPADGSLGALFGFIGVAPQHRRDVELLKQAIREQLGRLFGAGAARPRDLLLKDWAFDPATATAADLAPLAAHPRYGLPPALHNLWDGALLFGGSEVAPAFGGFLEGALEAAEAAFHRIDMPERKAGIAG